MTTTKLTPEQMLRLRRKLRERVFNLRDDEVIALAERYDVPLIDVKRNEDTSRK
jgi:hypothetical protein